MPAKQLFQDRTVVIATMHQKEAVIAPALEVAFGLHTEICPTLNTDDFGTFCGQRPRELSPVETARAKCLRALALTGRDLAIASEGSFGPHPSVYFVPADVETLVMIDQKHHLEFVVSEISLSTNFNARLVSSYEELKEFAQASGFPTHGLILRRSPKDYVDQVKGIREEALLEQYASKFLASYGQVYVETDMRAMHNPTRMKVIAQAVEKLIGVLKNGCPDCQTPGFSVSEVIPGLPCSHCGLPTRSTLAHRLSCQKCNFVLDKKYPHSKEHEDPMYCDFCNP